MGPLLGLACDVRRLTEMISRSEHGRQARRCMLPPQPVQLSLVLRVTWCSQSIGLRIMHWPMHVQNSTTICESTVLHDAYTIDGTGVLAPAHTQQHRTLVSLSTWNSEGPSTTSPHVDIRGHTAIEAVAST